MERPLHRDCPLAGLGFPVFALFSISFCGFGTCNLNSYTLFQFKLRPEFEEVIYRNFTAKCFFVLIRFSVIRFAFYTAALNFYKAASAMKV